jgi:hypothetical protein
MQCGSIKFRRRAALHVGHLPSLHRR